MSVPEDGSGRGPGTSASFATTHWSMVLAARDPDSPAARAALAELCRIYWYPLYAFIRRQGYASPDAQDLTQELFARLLEKDFLGGVSRDKGKFRSFLLAVCRHFLANERDRARARKRGGGRPLLPLDFNTAEERYSREPAHELTAEKLFERRWALTLLDQVLARLRQEFCSQGKTQLFDRLKCFLTGEKDKAPHAELAQELDMTAGAVKVAVHRLRRRYRDLLREEIARTVDTPDHIEDEIRQLFSVLDS
jgi:RNA polymerase sigma factor (sigma-70 family)